MATLTPKKEPITVTGEPLDLPYTPKQIEFFFELTEQFRCAPKGRRFGITSAAANFCIEKLIEGKKILWVDTVQSNLDRYIKRYFSYGLKQIKKKYWNYSQEKKELTICDGIMDLRSAERPENIEGFGYDYIIMNEAGIILKGQHGRDLWLNSVYPMTIDFQGTVLFIGTPKGKKAKKNEVGQKYSIFYELCCKGYNDKTSGFKLSNTGSELERTPKLPKWVTRRYTSYDNPLSSPEVIKEVSDDVPNAVRDQEIGGLFLDRGEGVVFKEEWFPIVYDLPAQHHWRRCILSMDTAFKKGAENDDSAATVILETDVGYFFLYSEADKFEFPELVKWTNDFGVNYRTKINYAGKLPDLSYILIEDKASGQSLIQVFKTDIKMPNVAITPDSDKYTRAVAISPLFETGKCFLLFGAWNRKFIDQMVDFNELMDSPDDIVDTVSQALNYFNSSMLIKNKPEVRKTEHRSETLRGY